MTYRDILLLLDEGANAKALIDASAELAARFDAHLTALYSQVEEPLPAFVAAQMTRTLMDQRRRALGEEVAALRSHFEASCGRQGVMGEWRQARVLTGDASDLLARHARYSDLIVAAQPDLDATDGARGRLLQELVLGAGRPLLLVPAIGAPPAFGRRAMIAWDAGREAARAVADALPLLRRAESVEVVTIDAARTGRHGEEPGADIARHLARHGVKVEVEQLRSGSLSVGDLLLNRAADRGLDLLVMGAYAHSRLRDLVLGGVTRHLMAHMTLPVFMAH